MWLRILGVGGALYISYKNKARKPYFHIFMKQPAGGTAYYAKGFLKFRPS